MKLFQEKILQLYSPKMASQPIERFRQLRMYIDDAISNSFKKSGDERAEALVKHLLVIRDYLSREINDNELRQLLLSEVVNVIQEIDKESLESKNNKKDIEEPDNEKKQKILEKRDLDPVIKLEKDR